MPLFTGLSEIPSFVRTRVRTSDLPEMDGGDLVLEDQAVSFRNRIAAREQTGRGIPDLLDWPAVPFVA